MSIRQIAAQGILSDYTLRQMLRDNRLPAVRVGKQKVLVDCDKLLEQLSNLKGDVQGGNA
jgi:excisionase family DNA binding protein